MNKQDRDLWLLINKPPDDKNIAPEPKPLKEKNKAAVELGRLGGKVGGYARAAKLSPERRSEIASIAANKRWGKE